jgi:hypothetical protein
MRVLQIFALVFGLAIGSNGQKALLSGTIYDATGARIVGASVIAIDQKNQKYETRTNDSGVYSLTLPFNLYDLSDKNFNVHKFRIAKYEISITASGFERTVFKDIKVVPVDGGKMHLDVALDVGSVSHPIEVNNRRE